MKLTKKRLALLWTALLTLSLALSGCASGKDIGNTASSTAAYESGGYYEAEETPEEYGDYEDGFYGYEAEKLEVPAEAAEGEISGVPQKLVYTAYAELETKDIQPALESVYRSIEAAGGVIQSESLYNLDAETVDGDAYSYSRGLPSAELTVRVPSENYRAFIAGLKADPDLIYARSVTSDTQNLTRTYYDMESRVNALRAEEEWLLEFMEEAETVSEMLEIKDRLTEVQREIESLTNSMKIIDYDADWSTVEITLSQVQRFTPGEEQNFGQRVAGYFETSGENFLDFMEGLLEFLILILPFLLVLAVIGMIVWLAVRSANKRRRKKMAALQQHQIQVPPQGPEGGNP